MPSFDVVSEIDLQEVDNAVNQVQKEIATRFDFKGGKSTIEYSRQDKQIKVVADDEMKLRSIHQMLDTKLAKRNVDIRCLEYSKPKEMSHNALRQEISLRAGINKEDGKRITKLIKDSKLKVQAQIQDEQVRVSGKKIDDLQSVIQLLKDSNLGMPLQFINMRE